MSEKREKSQRDFLEVKNLKKYFPTKKGLLHAVEDISFNIKKGETLGLVGESGCGKSTAGRAIIRLHEPTGGEIFLKGEDILKRKSRKEKKQLKREMQIVFQDPYSSLNPRINTFDLIADALYVNKIYDSKKEIRAVVEEMMETVGLEKRLMNSYPHELDGGRRQRIGIARALVMRPEFIVLDEPVSALDVSIQAQVLNLLQDIQKEKELTYLFISHDLSVVRHISDRVAVMYLGRIVELADYRTIFENPQHPYTKALLSAIPVPEYNYKAKRIILKGDVPSPIDPPDRCVFYGRCPHRKDICKGPHPVLKETEAGHFAACHLLEK